MSKRVVVGSRIGLHAGPAQTIAAAAASYAEPVILALADTEDSVNASSALLIMTLGAEFGAQVTVTSANPDAVSVISSLIEQELDSPRV
ncbi:MAG TPA: HPr family phosphocarrier protein [Arachnia sp.]|nr:HPr family phosphocarrier protein [Arachnia sp.]HMT86117.1 HPr family phosphocarrier protein [Arachnia sp.]